jgi:hypothetical protein
MATLLLPVRDRRWGATIAQGENDVGWFAVLASQSSSHGGKLREDVIESLDGRPLEQFQDPGTGSARDGRFYKKFRLFNINFYDNYC